MNEVAMDADVEVREYQSKRHVYAAFALALERILLLLLDKNEIRYQKTEARDKDPERLRIKLRQQRHTGKSLADITDLAGCRVVLYLEKDIAALAQVLWDEFDVVNDDEKISEDGYNARHFDIKLKNNRAQLAEYRDFAGLTCEVQLTTVLYHAWSALYHDDMYKNVESLREFDDRTFERIDQRFKKVMKEHITYASNEFAYLLDQLNRMREAKVILSTEFVRVSLLGSKSLNELLSSLNLYKEAIKHFGDKKADGKRAVEILKEVIRLASELRDVYDRDSLWKPDYADVIVAALETAEPLRYHYCEAVVRMCSDYILHENPRVRDEALKLVLRIAGYDFQALQKIGYGPQIVILDVLESLNEKALSDRSEFVRKCCESLLQPTFNINSMPSYNTVEFGQGALKGDDTCRSIRSRAIILLQKAFNNDESLAGKRETLRSLFTATRIAPNTSASTELVAMVLDDTIALCNWYKVPITTGALIIKSDIQGQIRWLKSGFGSPILVIIEELENSLNADDDYNVFRDMIGHDFGREPHGDYSAVKEYRLKAIADYVNRISPESQAQWMNRIEKILSNFPAAPHEYEYFFRFIEMVGANRPDFALQLLTAQFSNLEPFLPPLLEGLSKSDRKGDVGPILKDWIKVGDHLEAIAHLLNIMDTLDAEILRALVTQAVINGNIEVLRQCVLTMAERPELFDETREAFSIAIRKLTELKDSQWIAYLWRGARNLGNIVNEDEASAVLQNLMLSGHLEHNEMEIIESFIGRFPSLVIQFLKDRVQEKIANHSDWRDYYDAMPFSFNSSYLVFQQHWSVYFPLVLEWYKSTDRVGWNYPAEFVRACFPEWNNTLDSCLLDLMKSNDPATPDFVIDVLDSKDPSMAMQIVALEYLTRFGANTESRRKLILALSATGVVSGEYGLAEAYKDKQEWLKAWPQPNPNVIAFISEFTKDLLYREQQSRKRADQERHRLKADFE